MTAPPDKIITVAIADDHTLMRSALVNFISSDKKIKICIEAANGKELLDQLEKVGLTDVILLDISMPEMDGFETMIRLKKKYKDPAVIALTGYSDGLIFRMVALGVKGCVLKTQSHEDLLCALHTVSRNREYFSRQVKEMLYLDSDRTLHHKIISLKEKEIVFLKHLCSGMTYNNIAAKMHVSPYTVEDYKEALLEKFELKNKTELILLALRYKLV